MAPTLHAVGAVGLLLCRSAGGFLGGSGLVNGSERDSHSSMRLCRRRCGSGVCWQHQGATWWGLVTCGVTMLALLGLSGGCARWQEVADGLCSPFCGECGALKDIETHLAQAKFACQRIMLLVQRAFMLAGRQPCVVLLFLGGAVTCA